MTTGGSEMNRRGVTITAMLSIVRPRPAMARTFLDSSNEYEYPPDEYPPDGAKKGDAR